LHDAAALHFVPVARAGTRTVFLVGGLGVRTKRMACTISFHAVSFYGIGPNGKYASPSQGYLINWKYKFELTYHCFFWPWKEGVWVFVCQVA